MLLLTTYQFNKNPDLGVLSPNPRNFFNRLKQLEQHENQRLCASRLGFIAFNPAL